MAEIHCRGIVGVTVADTSEHEVLGGKVATPSIIPVYPYMTAAQINRILVEGNERIAVTERCAPGTIKKIGPAAESMGGQDVSGMYEAKVFDTSKLNSNNRLYSRELMQRNLDRLRPKFAEGGVCGSIDHGTGLAQQCIIWRDMRIDADGAGYGKFEIVPTRSGNDLKALCDAGSSIGMSTYGFGSGRKPTDAERTQYNMPAASDDEYDEDGNYCGPVMMGDDYTLQKIDGVDLPSVPDARIVQRQSNPAVPVSESGNVATVKGVPIAEACDNGLHWIQMGSCGHKLSECRCDAEGEKHYIYADRKCEKCGSVADGLSVQQFKSLMSESKPKRVVAQEGKQPLAKTYAQYLKGKDSFEPVGPLKLAADLSSDAFEIVPTWSGVRFVRKVVQTDDLYHFEGSPTEAVLKEIDSFWELKGEYEKYGVMHRRGAILHGSPGTGKSSSINQVSDMVTGRGDVVFYGRNVAVLKEGLTAFRDVEPDRKVVVILEDADEYIGYQEREMLNLLDGAESISGIFFLATTNYLNRFPERLLRPGRFDKKVHIGPPNLAGRTAYFQKKLGKVETAEEIASLAKETEGLSFGHLREIITAVYALKEPKAEVLARLMGKPVVAKDSITSGNIATEHPTRLSPQTEGKPTQTKLPSIPLEKPKQSESVMSEQVQRALNTFLESVKGSPDIELPQREVLPAEIAAQLEAKDAEIATHKAQIDKASSDHKAALDKVLAEKAELQAKVDAIEAERVEDKRLADVMTKASELLKDNAFSDTIVEDIKELAADKSFTAEKVDAVVKSRTARYEKAVGVKTTKEIPLGIHGKLVNDSDLPGTSEAEAELDAKQDSYVVEPASELKF